MNVKETIKVLRSEQEDIAKSHPLLVTIGFSKAYIAHRNIEKEIEKIVSAEISTLNIEKKALCEKYPKFGMNLIYINSGVPQEVLDAKNRVNAIESEILDLKNL